MTMGTPPSGLHAPFFLRPASKAAAAFMAPASSRVMKALRSGFAFARASAAETSAVLVILPAQISAAACRAVNPSRSGADAARDAAGTIQAASPAAARSNARGRWRMTLSFFSEQRRDSAQILAAGGGPACPHL